MIKEKHPVFEDLGFCSWIFLDNGSSSSLLLKTAIQTRWASVKNIEQVYGNTEQVYGNTEQVHKNIEE